MWERVASSEAASRVRGYYYRYQPLTRFLASLGTTLSHKGRGKKAAVQAYKLRAITSFMISLVPA